MIRLLRFFKRFAVLVPGIIIAYFSVRIIYPYFDQRLPVGIAIFITYVLAAYVLIPAVIRLGRLFIPAKHLPYYCVTPDGFASDPINIGIVSSRHALILAMEKAGWSVADKINITNSIRLIISSVFNHSYKSAPMSPLYLFGRHQDIGFEKQLDHSRGHRHHVRFWATEFQPSTHLTASKIQWTRKVELRRDQQLLWVGAASRDSGFGVIRHNFKISHMIHPNTDAERDLIQQELLAKELAKNVSEIKLYSPYKITNQVWRGYLRTDGKMKVLKLNPPKFMTSKRGSS